MGKRLYVGNLSFHTTKAVLESEFSKFGAVSDVHLVTDRETGQSRGFAFITMDNPAEADAAIAAMNGFSLDGRPLKVNEAQERTPGGGGGRSFGGGGGGGFGGGGGRGGGGGFGGGGGGGRGGRDRDRGDRRGGRDRDRY